jgi:hypothetical protein
VGVCSFVGACTPLGNLRNVVEGLHTVAPHYPILLLNHRPQFLATAFGVGGLALALILNQQIFVFLSFAAGNRQVGQSKTGPIRLTILIGLQLSLGCQYLDLQFMKSGSQTIQGTQTPFLKLEILVREEGEFAP